MASSFPVRRDNDWRPRMLQEQDRNFPERSFTIMAAGRDRRADRGAVDALYSIAVAALPPVRQLTPVGASAPTSEPCRVSAVPLAVQIVGRKQRHVLELLQVVDRQYAVAQHAQAGAAQLLQRPVDMDHRQAGGIG